jgi:phage terminase Nu1 subunit (DNA packaging protein)
MGKMTLEDIDALLAEPNPDPAPAHLVTATELADWLGMTPQRGGILARQAHLPRRADGRYPLKASVTAYAAFARVAAMGRKADEALAAQKLRVARESADKLALANAKARGDLLAAAEVERAWSGVLRDVRAGVLAAPSRIGSRLPHLSAHDVAEITKELTAVLSELSGN